MRPDPVRGALRAIVPILAALVAGGVVLLAFGADPLAYYGYVVERGLFSPSGLEATLTRMAPLLLIAAGLIVAFRAGLWNLGVDGQFLLAAVCAAAAAPALLPHLGGGLTLVAACVIGIVVGAAWSLLPAFLKAAQGINEIISTLMTSFLGLGLANLLIKTVFDDPTTTSPQTATLDVADRLGRIGGTTVHWGVVLAAVLVIAVHLMMRHTAIGLRLQMIGASPRAARHFGLNVGALTFLAFALSAGLVGLGGAVDVLGVHGNVAADWNPAYGLLAIPLVFLARFNGYAVIALVFVFAMLLIGGESAARRTDVPTFFVPVLIALMLVFLTLVEVAGQRRKVVV